MKDTDQALIAEIKASGRLPSPTGVALTILELSRDPQTDIEEMATVLKGDPALSGQLIKYANSAAVGNRNPVTSVQDALVRIGMRVVSQLCLGFSILSNSKRGQCEGFGYDAFWAHSLAMASGCQTLARTMKAVNPDEGFTCGLLAEIGGLALASVYPEMYTKVLEGWQYGARRRLLQIERQTLGIDRNAVTATLFRDWGLPEFYARGIESKDETDWADLEARSGGRDQGAALAHLLFAGNLAAEICTEKAPERHWRVLDFQNFARLYHLQDDDFINMYDEILVEWERMGKVLAVVTGKVPSMSALLKAARNSDGIIRGRRGRRDDVGQNGEGDEAAEHNRRRTDESVGGSPTPAPRAKKGAGAAASAAPDAGHEFSLAVETPFDFDELALTSLRILVATDCPVHEKILSHKLESDGHTVLTARDGRQALEIALSAEPQLIISDWMMPDLDGLELCRTLRSSPQLAHIHFIIMTSHDSNDELVEAFDAGINYYLVKPLNLTILRSLLRGAAREVANREEVQRQKEQLRRTNAEVSIANRMLKTMAMQDQLTELPNRRAGLEALDKAWGHAGRSGDPLLVMILDIDHFKAVNDTWGHDAGDEVLRATAHAMQAAIRDYDEICRFGGEEFLVVCPGAGQDVAVQVGNRIREAVESNEIDTPEFQGRVTISIGAAVRVDSVDSPKDLIKLADEALYAAKEAGRNKVCINVPEPVGA